MKKRLMVFMVALLAMTCIFAGGSTESKDSNSGLSGKLTITTNALDAQLTAFQTITDAYMEQNPGVEIELISYGKDYENLMKAKMAANDLPDIFATHGWSVKRYAEYLLPLNEFAFTDHIKPAAKEVLSTPNGDVLTLPMNFETTGIIYNKEILEKAGWTTVPRTFDEFLACCADVKALGVVPVYIAGKDTRQQANLMDLVAPSMLIATADNNDAALKDGSFDWNKWNQVSGFLVSLLDGGYLNKDCNTADPIYLPEKLAYGEVCFAFGAIVQIQNAWAINPDAKLSMMPIPANTDADDMILIGGERESYGIWKDSKNIELAKNFIEFASQPENIAGFCEATGMPCAFDNITVDNKIANDLADFGNLAVYAYFDREWLPSGMWATMRSIGGGLTSREITVAESSKIMEKSYNDLRSQIK